MQLNTAYEIIAYVGRASMAAALVATGTAIAGQWRGARVLGQLAVATSLAAVAISVATLVSAFAQVGGADAASKATMLAQTISEVLNCTLGPVPGAFIGLVGGACVWAMASRKLSPGTPPAPPT